MTHILKIDNNSFGCFTDKMSDEVCFIYLNFASVSRRYKIKEVVRDFNGGHGVINGMKFNHKHLPIDIIDSAIKCIDFLNKYHVKL